mmetsp:Transcript_21495/g.59514  ORF Transcript_21495/g.59514 Transcript_21495/m.59514 type:complete len:214 (-) Transcript_21495:1639-2280(-)
MLMSIRNHGQMWHVPTQPSLLLYIYIYISPFFSNLSLPTMLPCHDAIEPPPSACSTLKTFTMQPGIHFAHVKHTLPCHVSSTYCLAHGPAHMSCTHVQHTLPCHSTPHARTCHVTMHPSLDPETRLEPPGAQAKDVTWSVWAAAAATSAPARMSHTLTTPSPPPDASKGGPWCRKARLFTSLSCAWGSVRTGLGTRKSHTEMWRSLPPVTNVT